MRAVAAIWMAAPRGRAVARGVAAWALACALTAMLAGSAAAAPVWRIDSLSNTTVAPGTMAHFIVQTTNVGDAPVDASRHPVVVSGTLPPGFAFRGIAQIRGPIASWDCSASAGTSINCVDRTDVWTPADLPSKDKTFQLNASVSAGLLVGTIVTASFQVSGGGAIPNSASTVDPMLVSDVPPDFGIDAFDGEITSDAAGTPETRAGAHPFAASTSIDFNTTTVPVPLKGDLRPVEPTKDVRVDLPPGFVGNPTVVDTCTPEQLAGISDIESRPLCPPTSQVGMTIVRFNGGHGLQSSFPATPVYSVTPSADVPARFGFNVAGSVVTFDAVLRSDGSYGLSANVRNVPQALAIAGTTLTLWGVPSDSSHDAERACPGELSPPFGGPSCRSGAPLVPFLRNPTSCAAPAGSPVQDGLLTSVAVDSWVHPGAWGADGAPDLSDPAWKTSSFVSHLAPGYPSTPGGWGPHQLPTGCRSVPFRPDLVVAPSTPALAGKPSGFQFDLTLPQPQDPDGIAEGDLKQAVVRLPAGMRVSPSAADGLQACSPSQIGLRDQSDPTCPDGSKVGSLTIDTPLLARPLTGAIYLATPFDNPFGSLIALYIVARGPGVVVKIPGHVQADPVTGQLSTTFDDNPQVPFSRLHLEFAGGPRASLVAPTCGTHEVDWQMTSWSGKTVASSSTFTISHDGHGAACPPPQFSPGFSAGTTNPVAGAFSPFVLRLTREDDDEQLAGLSVQMPSGLTGKIASAELCGEAQAAAGTCADGSRIGSVTVGAGAGSNPFYITTGRAYLTGPYKGAPFGLSIVVPAVAGPFDLGNVVVRSALFVDKHTADVSVVSDPLPTILQGIPLDVRDVRVAVDKAGFFLNPTSCAEKTIAGTIVSTAGARAQIFSRFQVGDCASLGFTPRMVLTVGGRGHTARTRTTPLRTTVTMPEGDANLRSVSVVLPKTINARLTVIEDACTRAEFESDLAKCAHAKAGTATAVTPLLRDPLTGGVYFVKDGRGLPDLIVALRGQVDFDLIGRISIPGGSRLGTTFDAAPDVPIRSFALTLFGDPRNASIGARANLCSAKARRATAQLVYTAQNGRELHRSQRLAIRGCPKTRRR